MSESKTYGASDYPDTTVLLRLIKGHPQGPVWYTLFPTKRDAEEAVATLRSEGTWFHQQEDNGDTDDEVRDYLEMFKNMDEHVAEHFIGTYEEAQAKEAEWAAIEGGANA
jgi:hypothetical protein